MFIDLWLYSRFWNFFRINLRRPPSLQCNPMNREVAQLSRKRCGGCRTVDPDGEQPKTALPVALRSLYDMISIYQRSAQMNEGKITLILIKLLCHECFHHVRHYVHDGLCTGEFAAVIWRLDSFTVMTFAENLASENSPQSIAELRNGRVGD